MNDVQNNICDLKATPTIEKETVATALVNGNNGFGAVVGKFCMDLAIRKAKEVGVGVVSAHCKYNFFQSVQVRIYAIFKSLIQVICLINLSNIENCKKNYRISHLDTLSLSVVIISHISIK